MAVQFSDWRIEGDGRRHRSEEGRVGEERRSRWAPDHLKKKKNRNVATGTAKKKSTIRSTQIRCAIHWLDTIRAPVDTTARRRPILAGAKGQTMHRLNRRTS